MATFGFVVLCLTALTSLAASYLVAGKVCAPTAHSERLLATGVLAHLLPFGIWSAISLVHGFRPGWAPVVTVSACAGLAYWLGATKVDWREEWRTYARAVGEALRPSREGYLFLYPLLAATSVAFFVSLAQIIVYPTWSWDCVWFHQAQTRYVIQEHSLHYWADMPNGYVNGYPRLVEAISAYATLVMKSEVLDDASQFGWTLVGAAGVAAYARRFAAPAAVALGLGCMWILIPSVFLQIHTTHDDIAAAALLIAMSFFVTRFPMSAGSLAMATLCAGGLLATKISGLLHVVLLSPLVLLAGFASWRAGARPGMRPWHVALAVGGLALGAAQPVHNYLVTGNPFYPARIRVPLTHVLLPGTLDEESISNGLSFFRTPGGFQRMLDHWYGPAVATFPDIRGRPFGITFPYLVLPLCALVLVLALWRRNWSALALFYVAAAALMVPAAWWGRYILGVPSMALIAVSWLTVSRGPRLRWVQNGMLLVLACGAVADLPLHWEGYRQVPRVQDALAQDNNTRLRAEMNWMFPPDVIKARDTELGAGDVWAYDGSVQFLGELWNRSVTSRVAYVASNVPASTYVEAIKHSRAVWVAVQNATPAEAALVSELHAQRVGAHPWSGFTIWRIPRAR